MTIPSTFDPWVDRGKILDEGQGFLQGGFLGPDQGFLVPSEGLWEKRGKISDEGTGFLTDDQFGGFMGQGFLVGTGGLWTKRT